MLFGKISETIELALFSESIKGASHKRANKPCQDSRKILTTHDSVILAAADGHGSSSSPHSKRGSQYAVNVFCSIMSQYLDSYNDDKDALISFLRTEGDTTVSKAIDNEWKLRVERAYEKRTQKNDEAQHEYVEKPQIWKQYGTTLLGLVIMPSCYFAFQLGDGDIVLVDDIGVKIAVEAEKLLGTETHSLSQPEAWKKAVSTVMHYPDASNRFAFMVATDGFANSYPSEDAFMDTCLDYFTTIKEHGAEAVESNLKSWLNETSKMGSGDDITVLFAYNGGHRCVG